MLDSGAYNVHWIPYDWTVNEMPQDEAADQDDVDADANP